MADDEVAALREQLINARADLRVKDEQLNSAHADIATARNDLRVNDALLHAKDALLREQDVLLREKAEQLDGANELFNRVQATLSSVLDDFNAKEERRLEQLRMKDEDLRVMNEELKSERALHLNAEANHVIVRGELCAKEGQLERKDEQHRAELSAKDALIKRKEDQLERKDEQYQDQLTARDNHIGRQLKRHHQQVIAKEIQLQQQYEERVELQTEQRRMRARLDRLSNNQQNARQITHQSITG